MSDKPPSDDGGQAFSTRRASGYGESGMTLLDWFAGQALSAISIDYTQNDMPTADDVSYAAYKIASRMIAEKRRLEDCES